MQVLETCFKQRAYDGKWEKLIRVFDFDNKYEYKNEYGVKTTLTPTKWLVEKVYDYELEVV